MEPIDLTKQRTVTNVKAEWPPNIEKIKVHMGPEYARTVENFDTAVPVFTYYPYIYVPTGHELPPDLTEHETTHLRQQEHFPGGADGWWDKWLNDKNFRIEQEVEAYAVQLHCWRGAPNRVFKQVKERLAMDLSGPAYGSFISFSVAESRIRHAEKTLNNDS